MCSKSEVVESVGPVAVKVIALVACLAVFAPLLAAFALPFVR